MIYSLLEVFLRLSAEDAHSLVRSISSEAVRVAAGIKPYSVSSPVELKLELVSRGVIPRNRPGLSVIDGRTYTVSGKNVEEALSLL